jgi:hypothetical protein
MFLGTTAVGAWGPVANPTAGLWPGKARTSRPNASDRLVEVWDGAAWIPTHYDSGWRDVSADLANGATGTLFLRRYSSTMHLRGFLTAPQGGLAYAAPIYDLPAGFRNAKLYAGSIGVGRTGSGTLVAVGIDVGSGAQALIALAAITASDTITLGLVSDVEDTVPASLPGTLIATAP